MLNKSTLVALLVSLWYYPCAWSQEEDEVHPEVQKALAAWKKRQEEYPAVEYSFKLKCNFRSNKVLSSPIKWKEYHLIQDGSNKMVRFDEANYSIDGLTSKTNYHIMTKSLNVKHSTSLITRSKIQKRLLRLAIFLPIRCYPENYDLSKSISAASVILKKMF